MIFTHSEIHQDWEESCDVCVVGSGAGGAVMAAELAQAGLSVILLEEGGYHQPSTFNTPHTMESLARLYRGGGGTVFFGKPNVLFSEGRCVGGSTTINGGMCWRTPEKILKRWQWENGLQDFSPEKMDFFFKRVEKNISVNPILPEARNEDSELLKKGAEALGYKVKPNLRAHKACVGANQCLTGCPTGAKQSTLVTYIPEFLNARGRIYSDCRVKKVLHHNGRATGVSGVVIDADTKKAKCKFEIKAKTVVVCGGAIQTPLLLKRSKIPNQSKLLGKNLLVHPNTKVLGIFENPVYGWKGVNQAYQVTEFMDEGILFAVNFIPPSIMALAIPFHGTHLLETMREIYNHCVAGAALIEDTSSGEVHSLPGDQGYVTYQLNGPDFERSKRAVALLAEIYFAAGAKRVLLPFVPLPEIKSPDEIKKIYEMPLKPIDLELMTVHIMGTCQMGRDAKRSVVNSHGQVHGMVNLFVADASLFPSSIGVNPQLTIMAMSTRIAHYIAENKSRIFDI